MKLKKVLSIMLAGGMVLGMLSGCGAKEKEESKEPEKEVASEESKVADSSESEEPEEVSYNTYPVDTDVTLRFYVADQLTLSSKYTDYNDVPFNQGLEEKTGIDIQWESATVGSDVQASFNLLLQEEDLPDIILGTGLASAQKMEEYIRDGIAQDITEYLPTYAPDYWEFINSEEQAMNRQMLKVGESLPAFIGVRETGNYGTWAGSVVRKDWLDALGLEIPTTIQEFEDVAIAFHEEYDAVIGVSAVSWRAGNGFWAGALGSQAVYEQRYYVEDGEVKCANTQEEWKDFLTLMNKWYDMGILDPNFTTADDTSVRTLAAEGKMGISYTAGSQLRAWKTDAETNGTGAEWIGIAEPVAEEGGKNPFTQVEQSTWIGGNGAFVTTDCTEEELIVALQFLNYLYTEEGMEYWNWGQKGVSYDVDADGNYYYTDQITKDERGEAQARRDYCGNYGTGLSVQLDSAQAAIPGQDVAAIEAWTSNTVARDYMLPDLTFTEDEMMAKSDIESALSTYISETAFRFIVGEEPLDNFDDFVDTLYDMKLQDALDIYNAAYQRFLNK